MNLQDQAQTIRFFEGMGKPLSAREVEILLEEEEDTSNTFLFGDGKEGGFEGLDLVLVDEQRTCANCQHFAAGRFSAYCYHFLRPRVLKPGAPACSWFKRRG